MSSRRVDLPRPAPFLRWAGSKRKALPALSEYWRPEYTRYVEPFVGSGALFFYLLPKRAVLGDINDNLIQTYRQVRDNPSRVAGQLGKMSVGPAHYYRWRRVPDSALEPHVRAARFIYLNRFCFNGLFRTNKNGVFNVPYGGHKSGRLPSTDALTSCAHLLRRAALHAAPFEEVLERTRPGDFVYLDPPYQVASRRVFHEYDPAGFSETHLKRLRQELRKLDRSSIPFLLSYEDSDEGIMLARGFSSTSILVRRNISGFTSFRRLASELLISNCPPGS